jgi:hypothetical protein
MQFVLEEHNILELMLGWPIGYSFKSPLMKDFILFLSSYAHSSTTTYAFLSLSNLGSNGSTKF